MLLGFAKNPSAQEKFSAYNFSFTKMDGSQLNLAEYTGQVLLIVNTASNCGFTNQYSGLQELYIKYKDRGFTVIAVPSNDFAGQEPASNEEIKSFCTGTFGITFPIVKKEKVLGSDAHPFYKAVADNMGLIAAPKWNFHKYLIDPQGNVINYFLPITKPESLEGDIEKLLPR